MRDVYVAGVGMTVFGKRPEATLKSLTAEATREALEDAGVTPQDLEQAFFANAIGGAIVNQEMVAGQVALRPLGIEGLPIVNVENACASASTALMLGVQAVASGAASVVLCVGAEKMSHRDKGWALAAIGRAVDVDEVFGDLGPQPGGRSHFMDIYAGEARELMERSGARPEDFAAIAVKNQGNGARNPRAQYGAATTVAEVLAAREIVPPLTLPMCSPLSDGAAAVVLVSADHLGAVRGRAVRIAASALVSGGHGREAEPQGSATARAARRAYEQAGIGPEDVDLAEVHDAAAPAELAAYEALGLAAAGEGAALIREGLTEIGGRIPVNTSGGLLAKGHPIGATGLAQVHELVEQLRGTAGPRQVDGARVGLAHNGGGWLQGDNAAVVVSVLERVERPS
jgi:acetyl-CoA acetyltransferase